MVTVYNSSGFSPTLSKPVRMYGHIAKISSIVLSPEFGVAVSCSDDGSVVTWDLHTKNLLNSTNESYGEEIKCALCRSTGDIVTVSKSGIMSLYSINLKKITEKKVEPRVTALAWTQCAEGISYSI